MSLINDIKKEIVNRISTDVTSVQEISGYEKIPQRGFPAVVVFCSGNEADYISTIDNMRTYSFVIRIFEQIGHDIDNNDAKERAERIVGNVVSDLINSFDKYYTLGDTVDYCLASPSKWGYAQIDTGWMRTADIVFQVKKSFDIING